MSCSCEIYDFDGFSAPEIRKSRRDRRCSECRRIIKRGEKYERYSVVVDGDWSHDDTCLICAEIRDAIMPAWAVGQVWDDILDCLDGSPPEATKMMKLSKPARDYMCDRIEQEWVK